MFMFAVLSPGIDRYLLWLVASTCKGIFIYSLRTTGGLCWSAGIDSYLRVVAGTLWGSESTQRGSSGVHWGLQMGLWAPRVTADTPRDSVGTLLGSAGSLGLWVLRRAPQVLRRGQQVFRRGLHVLCRVPRVLWWALRGSTGTARGSAGS